MECKRCNANISVKNKTCPLCGNRMTDDGRNRDNVFPVIKTRSKKEQLFINVMTLVLFSGSVLCVMLNIAISTEFLWSLFVVAGALCLWVSLVVALKVKRHLPRAIFWVVLLIAFLAGAWDVSTGSHGWSLDYVIPILFSAAIIMIRLISGVLKMAMSDYVVYLIINGLLGIIPFIFVLTGILNTVIPSIICTSISIISLGILFIFDRRQMIDEIHRRTHI